MNTVNLFRSRLCLFAILLAVAMVGGACTSRSDRPAPSVEPVVFPAPPDTARIQFLTSIGSSADIVPAPSGLSRYVTGIEPEQREIVKPYGITVAGGRIYICDSMLGGLEIIDLSDRTFEYFTPGGLGRLQKPINCAVDGDGTLFVADAGREQVVVFTAAGRFVHAIGGGGTMGRPTDVALGDGRVWVADVRSRCVRVYSRDGFLPVDTIPAATDGDGALYSPTNLEVAGDRLYVSDFGDFRVKVYNLDGEYLGSVGRYGRRPGEFARPKGVAVDRHGGLYVVDAAFENVQMFDDHQRLLMFFGGGNRGPGSMWLPAGITVDYDHLDYFQPYVYRQFELEHLIFVTNQYGPDKISVYGFIRPREGS